MVHLLTDGFRMLEVKFKNNLTLEENATDRGKLTVAENSTLNTLHLHPLNKALYFAN